MLLVARTRLLILSGFPLFANHAIGISTGRPNTQRASHPHVAGHPQDAATGQPSTSYDANNAADSGHTVTGNDAKRPSGVHPGQFSYTHPKAAGRFGTAGDAGPANTAQQCTQHSTTRRADNGKGTCTEHGIGPHTARQHHITPFGGRTRYTTPTSIGATRSTTKGETDAPSALSGSQQEKGVREKWPFDHEKWPSEFKHYPR